MKRRGKSFFSFVTLTALVSLVLCGALGTASAEVKEIRIARQYGISYLPLMIMDENKLIEKHAKAEGLGDITVEWKKFAGGADMNTALLSNSLDFASGGVAPMIKMWAKTKGNSNVKAVCAINSMPLLLNTTNPKVKTIKDFTDNDRIALPAVKVSIQAVILQMAAAKVFGESHYDKLDHLTVTMSHPDGLAAFLSRRSGITGHFSGPPFQYDELKDPGVHTVLNSFDVLGGPHTFNLVWTTSDFYKENPKTYAAVAAAIKEAIDMINRDKKAAAQIYLKMSKSKATLAEIEKMLDDPQVNYTITPLHTMKFADFLYKVGAIKMKPASWKDMFFPNVANLQGS